MLIDRTHRGWAGFTGLLLVVATSVYVVYARTWPNGPNGRSWPGMMFGVGGTLMMLFAGALTLRKKTVRWRFGSLASWLRAHIWIGLLSVPMILFHAAFRWGGWLEMALWLTLAVIIVSGIVGLVLQNLLPRTMKLQLSHEAIPDQFGEVCRQLVREADEKVIAQCTPAVMEALIQRSSDLPKSTNGSRNVKADSAKAKTELAIAKTESPLDRLARFHVETVRPYLTAASVRNPQLASNEQAHLLFDQERWNLPEACHATVDVLEELYQKRSELARQMRLYRVLHLWLRIHVPCSIVLLVLTAIHIVASLFY